MKLLLQIICLQVFIVIISNFFKEYFHEIYYGYSYISFIFLGRKRNVEHWIGHPNFDLINHDIVNPLYIEVDEIYHLASPASPPHYMYNPVKTIKTNTVGTVNALGLAKRVNAKILIASTSEVYGDPEVIILIYFSIKTKHVINLNTYYKLKTRLNPFQLLGTSTK